MEQKNKKRLLIKLSKFLSLILRHRPEKLGIQLDEGGWTDFDELVAAAKSKNIHITREKIEIIVAQDDKQRYSLSDDGERIRANQGHSINISLGLEAIAPPKILYHGTAERFIAGIQKNGLQKKRRTHVHLSGDEETAIKVGQRHGKPVVLIVHAREMHAKGYAFYQAANGVWLTENIPAEFLTFP